MRYIELAVKPSSNGGGGLQTTQPSVSPLSRTIYPGAKNVVIY